MATAQAILAQDFGSRFTSGFARCFLSGDFWERLLGLVVLEGSDFGRRARWEVPCRFGKIFSGLGGDWVAGCVLVS